MTIRERKIRFYMLIYKWALKRWRITQNSPEIRRKTLNISNHALLRYAERIDGYSFDKARIVMGSHAVKEKLDELGGDGTFVVDGLCYVAIDGTIKTVYKPNGYKKTLNTLRNNNGIKTWSF